MTGRRKFLVSTASLALGFAGTRALACSMPSIRYVPLEDFPGQTGPRNYYEYIRKLFHADLITRDESELIILNIAKNAETAHYIPVEINMEKRQSDNLKCKRLALILESDLTYRNKNNREFMIQGYQVVFDVMFSTQANCYFRTAMKIFSRNSKVIAIAVVEDDANKKIFITKSKKYISHAYVCDSTKYVKTKEQANHLNAGH